MKHELRDNRASYHGKISFKGSKNVNTIIFDAISGHDVFEQEF